MPKTCKETNCSNHVFGGGYCKFHQYLRTDKKPKTSKLNTRIKQISTKQAILNKEYSEERKFFLSNPKNQLCQAKLLNCDGRATDIHHKKGRGKYLLDTSTWLSVCRSCHMIIEANPAFAKQLNLSESRHDKE